MAQQGDMKASVIITVDSAKAQADLRAFGATASQVFGKLEADLIAAEAKAQRFAKTRAAMQGLGIGLIAVGAGALVAAKGMLDLSSKMQQAEISFTSILKDAGAAKQFVKDLQEFAKSTPFDFMDLQPISRQLLNAGFAAKEIIPTMRVLGDTMGALGQGPEAMDRVVRAFQQIRAKGKISMEELNQLAETGLPVFPILREELKLTGEEMSRIGEKGIEAGVGIEALLRGMEKRYGGGMKAQEGTWGQVLSNLTEGVSLALADMGKGILPVAKQLADAFVGVLDGLRAMSPEAKSALGLIVATGGAALVTVGALVLGVNALTTALVSAGIAASTMALALANPYVLGAVIIGAIVADILLMAGAWDKANAASKKYVEDLQAGGEKAAAAVKKLRGDLEDAATKMEELQKKAAAKGMAPDEYAREDEQRRAAARFRGGAPNADRAENRRAELEATNKQIEKTIKSWEDAKAAHAKYAEGTKEHADADILLLNERLNLLALYTKKYMLEGNKDMAARMVQRAIELKDQLGIAKKAFEDLTKAEQESAKEADRQAKAKEAAEKQADAWDKAADAHRAYADAVKDGAKQISDAYRSLGEAQDAVREAEAQYTKDVGKAWDTYNEAIADAEEKATKTVEDAKDKFVAAFEKREAAVQSLKDAYEDYNERVLELEASWQDKSKSAWERYANAVEKERRKTLPKAEVKRLEAQDEAARIEELRQDYLKTLPELTSAQQLARETPRGPRLTEAEKLQRDFQRREGDLQKAISSTDVFGRARGANELLDEAQRELDEAPAKAAAQLAKDRAKAEENLNDALDAARDRLDASYKRREEAEYRLAEVVEQVAERWEKAWQKVNEAERAYNEAYPNDAVAMTGAPMLPTTNAGTRRDVYGGGTGPAGQPIVIQIGGNVYGDEALRKAMTEALRNAGIGA